MHSLPGHNPPAQVLSESGRPAPASAPEPDRPWSQPQVPLQAGPSPPLSMEAVAVGVVAVVAGAGAVGLCVGCCLGGLVAGLRPALLAARWRGRAPGGPPYDLATVITYALQQPREPGFDMTQAEACMFLHQWRHASTAAAAAASPVEAAQRRGRPSAG